MRIVVDANVFLSALISERTRRIFLIDEFEFLTTERTTWEVKKYIPEFAFKLAKKLKKEGIENIVNQLELSLFTIFDNLPIIALQERDYQSKRSLAKELISQRDPKDVDILALTLKTKVPLWSQDKDFEPIAKEGYIKLLKTHQVLKIISKLQL